ncbi:MAG: HAMP domain-containing histidine kinase [Lachnospiraceae bacterium]|nr:HAMP domain-containing histidine kinase [Lachnospiraceae bacterium]
MKNYNKLIGGSLLFYLVIALWTGLALWRQGEDKEQFYKVEINRIMADIGSEEDIKNVDFSAYQQVKGIAWLPACESDKERVVSFYNGANGTKSVIYPLYDGEKAAGYLRFDYQEHTSNVQTLLVAEGALSVLEVFVIAVLLYLRAHLILPFHRMQDMTYELSKGNLQSDVKADKNQYFGKFLWGLSGLKDELVVSRKRELELQKEKKLLLLTLSHDIKTPLNMIKLYGRALEDGIYPEEADRTKAYRQIAEKAAQIESFVGEIVKASREDILAIEVEKGEFYFEELIQRIESVYVEKCALQKCDFMIGAYQNRIFQGDFNRLFEVFENLFENAFKYGDGRRIELSFYEEEYCQLIRVFNTGEPVSEKELVHLFDSFFRGENTRGQQGNGLGLYICREIMHKLGGEIFAERESGGMAFVVVLPM